MQQTGKLTDDTIKEAAKGKRPRKLSDGKGLVLLLHENGSNYWRHRYYVAGREKTLSYGLYPDVSIEGARALRDASIRRMKQGEDPGIKPVKPIDFERFAQSWHTWFYGAGADPGKRDTWGGYASRLSDKHVGKVVSRFDRIILPKWAKRRTVDITSADALGLIVAVQKDLETRGFCSDVAHRIKHHLRLLWNDAITRQTLTGVSRNIIEPVVTSSTLQPVVRRNHSAATDPYDLREILVKIDGYQGQGKAVQLALRLLYLTLSRPGMVRGAKWSELHVYKRNANLMDKKNITRQRYDFIVDSDYGRFLLTPALWIVPAERMKIKTTDTDGKPRDHIIPLSTQACEVLIELHKITGESEHLFPGFRANRTISENTLNAALRTLGVSGEQHVSHGFRASGTSILSASPLNYDRDIIEAQLSHVVKDKHGGAYHRAKFLGERIEMIQTWADYCDQIKAGNYGYIDKDRPGKLSTAQDRLAALLAARETKTCGQSIT